MTNKSAHQYFSYDDHTSIPFKLVNLLPSSNNNERESAHRHNFFQLFFFTQTGGQHLIDFEEYRCQQYQVHVVNPGNIHRLNRNQFTKGYVLLFSREFFDNQQPNFDLFLYRNDFDKVIDFSKTSFESIVVQIEEMKNALPINGYLGELKIKSLLNLIVVQVQQQLKFEKTIHNEHAQIVNDFQKLIEMHFAHHHQLNHYTNLLGIQPSKINNATKSVNGKTGSEMIQERLLLEAKRLLLFSNRTIKETAYTLGYNDPSYFNRFFRKHLGETPLNYKNKHIHKYHKR